MNEKSNWVINLFWSSLLVRVVATTFISSIVIVVITSGLLYTQVSNEVLDAKRQTSIAMAGEQLETMQEQLINTDLKTASVYERINQIAEESVHGSSGYLLVVEGPVATIVSENLDTRSVPQSIRSTIASKFGNYIVPTEITYLDDKKSEPGLVVGGALTVPTQGFKVPVFFVFPLTQESQTINIVTQAISSTGALMVGLLVLVGIIVSQQTTRPIRNASKVAERLADGKLDERLPVKGKDEIAKLAISMNHMADELQNQILQLEELSRLQQRFVSDVSHELRTPLTTVKMAAEMLYERKSDLSVHASRATELMYTELERFETLLADLLEISRIDAGAVKLNLEQIDLAEVVRFELEVAAPIAENMKTKLELTVYGDTIVQADPKRIRRVIRNLLSNAIEHGQANPVQVKLVGEPDSVQLSVTDHGIGFDEEQAKHLFDRFWRADPSRKRTLGGTGLGLAISKEDAKLHHGTLTAVGKKNVGACFTLSIPKNFWEESSDLSLLKSSVLQGDENEHQKTANKQNSEIVTHSSSLKTYSGGVNG